MPKYTAVAVIHFSDGGPDEITSLGSGTKEECIQITDMTDTVSYSGNRPIASAEAMILDGADCEDDHNAKASQIHEPLPGGRFGDGDYI